MSLMTSEKMHVPLSRPSIDGDDVAAVLEVLHSPSLSMGPKVRGFELAMARYAGTAVAVAVNSGTSGLHLCLAAAGIGPGDEVITTPFSFVASANCALYQGATPVFVDIDPLTLNIDPNQVEDRLTARTRALLPVDVFGQPSPIEDLMAIADRYGLRLIRDACEAIGAERNGRRIGSQGLATVFAFYPNKQMTTGEGGVIVTNDVPYSKILRSLSNQGRDDDGTWMNHVRLGYNYRLDEMSAAWGSRSSGARRDHRSSCPGRILVHRKSQRTRRSAGPLRGGRDHADELVRLRRPPRRADRPRSPHGRAAGGRHPLPPLLRSHPPTALVSAAIRLQAR